MEPQEFKNIKIKFRHYDCHPVIVWYVTTERTGIMLRASTGEPVVTATVNESDYPDYPMDEVLIKDFSENTGIYNSLVDAVIIDKNIINVYRKNYIHALHCKIIHPDIIKFINSTQNPRFKEVKNENLIFDLETTGTFFGKIAFTKFQALLK